MLEDERLITTHASVFTTESFLRRNHSYLLRHDGRAARLRLSVLQGAQHTIMWRFIFPILVLVHVNLTFGAYRFDRTVSLKHQVLLPRIRIAYNFLIIIILLLFLLL